MYLKPIKDYPSYSLPMADEIFKAINREIFAPLLAIMSNKKTITFSNALAGGKPTLHFKGIPIVIENPAGSLRHGKNWTQQMANDYGYICDTKAIDGDELDCFIGPDRTSRRMFVVEQLKPRTKKFDEFKIMFGFNTIDEAREAYLANYQIGWKGLGHIHEYAIAFFHQWYKTMHTPLENATISSVQEALRTGKIQYVGGYFYGDFSAVLSRELRNMGAKFNKVKKAYYLPAIDLPTNLAHAIIAGNQKAKKQITDINKLIDSVEAKKIEAIDLEPFFGNVLARLEKQFFITTKKVTPSEIEIPLNPKFYDTIKQTYTENLDYYIQKMKNDQIVRLREKVAKNVALGFRAETMIDDILKSKSMTRNHARFLAKQETSLMTASYREARYADVGVTEYVWSTSMDERVRPMASVRGKARLNNHRILQGRKFKFSEPPVVDSATNRRCNPGQDYGCRCTAIPYIANRPNFVQPIPEQQLLEV